MTNEEALKELKERVEFFSSDWNGACDEYRDVLQKACDALEKQILKKPNTVDDVMRCPVCNNNLDVSPWYQTFCEDCGQAIDWTEEEFR